jgi:hypothetical protein
MFTLQATLLGVSGVIAILFGFRYALAREFMPYHATVAGRSWAELEPGVQAIILGMYRIMGAGFFTYGLTLLWLLLPLRDGQQWAALAAFTLTIASLVPVLYVTLWLRNVQPAAKTPVAPAVLVLVLALAGSLASLLPWR